MNTLLDLAWLIPASPFFAGVLVVVLLISFNRTMNRLTKPVSFLIINCIGISTILSLTLYLKHLSGEIFDLHIHFLKYDFIEKFYLVNKSAIFLTAIGFSFFITCLISYYRLPRSNGYVRYLALLSILCGTLSTLILDNSLFLKMFSTIF